VGGEDDMGLAYSERLEACESGICMPVNWFVGCKGDRHALDVCRDARMVSPGANEVSPIQDETR